MTQTAYKFQEQMQIRSILKDDCERVYILNDIAKCVGYKAPHKFSERCEYQKEKVVVRWKTGVKRGQSLMWAVNFENYKLIAEAYEFPPELTKFISTIEKGSKKKTDESPKKQGDVKTQAVQENDIGKLIDNMMLALLELKRAIN